MSGNAKKHRKRVAPLWLADKPTEQSIEFVAAQTPRKRGPTTAGKKLTPPIEKPKPSLEFLDDSSSSDEEYQITLVKSPGRANKKPISMPSTSRTSPSAKSSNSTKNQNQKRLRVESCSDKFQNQVAGTSSTVSDKVEKNTGAQSSKEVLDRDDDEHDLPPTTQELAIQCWKCHIQLKPSRLYCTHVHAHLQVPVCVVCSEEVAFPANEDACVGCGEEEEEQYLCDHCPRSFCHLCLAQAYGGGRSGLEKAKSLADDDSPWRCLSCDPPPALQKLQEELCPAEDEGGSMQDSPTQRSVEDVLEQLYDVETEKRALEEWDDWGVREAKEEEILKEFREDNPSLSESELKKLVADELEAWQDLCIKHDHRLSDMASSLQEELEVTFDVDLSKFYKTHFGGNGGQKAGAGSEEEVEEEAWKRAADRAIAQREKTEKKAMKDPLAREIYQKSIPEMVEDLETNSDDEKGCTGEGFRSFNYKPSKADIDDAIAAEDELFAREKVSILKKYNNDMDTKEIFDEERETSRQGPGCTSRVRRDNLVTVMRIQRKRNVPAPKAKTIISPSADAKNKPVSQIVVTAAQAAPETTRQTKVLPKEREAITPAATDIVDLTDDDPNLFSRKSTTSVSGAASTALLSHNVGQQTQEGNDRYVEFDDDYYRPANPEYDNSELVLSSPDMFHSTSGCRVKTIKVSTKLSSSMKEHQKEGVKFLWKNAFSDLNVRTCPTEELQEMKSVGGAICAFCMGAGKSLTAIATIYTALTHPSLKGKSGEQFIQTVLLVVPVNTISSWLAEFSKWTGRLDPSIMVFNLQVEGAARPYVVRDWDRRGGILLVGKDNFSKLSKENPLILRTDCVILDESHTMLSNRKSAVYKALSQITTKRRLLLTGTPLQNNVLEYYRMIQWMRPGVLDSSEAAFEKEFAIPIQTGMATDCSPAEIRECDLRSAQLRSILEPYVLRRDASVLRKELPAMQQVVMHLRPNKMQTRLYQVLKNFEKRKNITSFFKRFHLARPIHNHPACLLMSSKDSSESESDGSDNEGAEGAEGAKKQPWWQRFVDKQGLTRVRAVNNGPKVVLFLHILAHSIQVGDKVVVFSQCLSTLDFLEEVLAKESWGDEVASLAAAFPNLKLGGWTKGVEYLRIDGNIDSESRGSLIKKFNGVEETPEERVQLFLISSKAGGIGITLTAANRVILMDSHYNPTIQQQALFRCYRYGQEKQVFCYRFLAEGTGEEKIYSRSVNKSGIAMRLIDGKNIERNFTQSELSNLVLTDMWVQCDRCEKWRMLNGEDEEQLPDKWFCEMNKTDPLNNTCTAEEKSRRWYYQNFQRDMIDTSCVPVQSEAKNQQAVATSDFDDKEPSDVLDQKKELLTQQDEILVKLLNKQETSALISKHYFHEALLEPVENKVATDTTLSSEVEGDKDTILKKPPAKKKEKTTPKPPKKKCNLTSSDSVKVKEAAQDKPATKAETDVNPASKEEEAKTFQASDAQKLLRRPHLQTEAKTKPSFDQAPSPIKRYRANQLQTPKKMAADSKQPMVARSSPRLKQKSLIDSQGNSVGGKKRLCRHESVDSVSPAKRARNEDGCSNNAAGKAAKGHEKRNSRQLEGGMSNKKKKRHTESLKDGGRKNLGEGNTCTDVSATSETYDTNKDGAMKLAVNLSTKSLAENNRRKSVPITGTSTAIKKRARNRKFSKSLSSQSNETKSENVAEVIDLLDSSDEE